MVAASRPGKTKVFYGHFIVLAAFLTMTLTFGAVNSFGVFLKPVANEFGWTVATVSGAYSVSILLRGLLGIVTGKLSDRFGPRIVVTICGLFFGLGHLLMSQVHTVWQIYLFYGVIVGIGQSASWVPLTSTVTRWYVKRRGMMTGIVLSGIGVGTMFIPPVVRWLIASYGWRPSYTILAIVAVALVLAAQFLKRDPAKMGLLPYGQDEILDGKVSVPDSGLSLKEALRTRQFWILSTLYFSGLLIAQSITVHIVAHATGLGISSIAAVSLLTVIGGMSAIGRITSGGIADRIGNKLALTISFISLTVAMLWLIPARELWLFYLIAVVFGFGSGGYATLMAPLVAQLFGQVSLGVIVGSMFFINNFGGTVGPVLAGAIFDRFGSYQLAFVINAVLGALSLLLALTLKPVQRQNPKDNVV